jgi:hypothetical protein
MNPPSDIEQTTRYVKVSCRPLLGDAACATAVYALCGERAETTVKGFHRRFGWNG